MAAPSPPLWFCPTSLPHRERCRRPLPHCSLPGQAQGWAEPWFCAGGFGADQSSGWGGGLGWQPPCLQTTCSPAQTHGFTPQQGGTKLEATPQPLHEQPKTINSAPFSAQLLLEEAPPASATRHWENATNKLGMGSCNKRALQTRPRPRTKPLLQSAGPPPALGRARRSPHRARHSPYRQR